jgi:hypothetical protein
LMSAMILKFCWLACLGSFVLISKIFNEYATFKILFFFEMNLRIRHYHQ